MIMRLVRRSRFIPFWKLDLLRIAQNGQKGLGADIVPASSFAYLILFLQVFSFAILNAIWVLPGTIGLRYACLILGACLSFYPIYQARKLLLQKRALPIWFLVALFGWATFHLFFLSQNKVLQLEEFSSIWKRAAIGLWFAFGMGLSIFRLDQQTNRSKWWQLSYWIIFYCGLLAPTLIYLIKVLLAMYGQQWGIQIPQSIQMYVGAHSVYMAKTAYVAFCLPALAVALGMLLQNIQNHRWLSLGNIFYILTIPAVFIVFYLENIKNGVAYGTLLIAIFLFCLLATLFKGHWFLKIILGACLVTASIFFISKHLEQNTSWRTFAADTKIALDINQYQQWKYSGARGYPNNALGVPVSVTNYERVSWAKVGIKLIEQNPLGYGLIERSFGRQAKVSWPDSLLHQSHSGWIDLTLGIGIPGAILLLGALWMLLWQLRAEEQEQGLRSNSWKRASRWAIGGLFLMWCTTEISQKVYFEALIFWLALGAGVSLNPVKNKTTRP